VSHRRLKCRTYQRELRRHSASLLSVEGYLICVNAILRAIGNNSYTVQTA
jgi:hypothetical protein